MVKNFILGISCYYHDSAATLLKDGEIISAVQEERFSRKKHDSSFPVNTINYVLKKIPLICEILKILCIIRNHYWLLREFYIHHYVIIEN